MKDWCCPCIFLRIYILVKHNQLSFTRKPLEYFTSVSTTCKSEVNINAICMNIQTIKTFLKHNWNVVFVLIFILHHFLYYPLLHLLNQQNLTCSLRSFRSIWIYPRFQFGRYRQLTLLLFSDRRVPCAPKESKFVLFYQEIHLLHPDETNDKTFDSSV